MKFRYSKRLSLDFLGEEWKEAYVDLEGFTVKDMRGQISKLSSLNQQNMEDVVKGLEITVNLLKERFIGGKAVAADGSLVDLKKDDLDDLPAEVLNRLVSFLSQTSEMNK